MVTITNTTRTSRAVLLATRVFYNVSSAFGAVRGKHCLAMYGNLRYRRDLLKDKNTVIDTTIKICTKEKKKEGSD